DQHDIHHDNTAHHQGDRCDTNGHKINICCRLAIKVEEDILCFQGEPFIVFLVKKSPAPVAHHGSHLIFSYFQLLCGRHLDEDNDRIASAINLLIGRIGNVSDAISRGAENRAQRLKHADDLKRATGDSNLLANYAIGRGPAKKIGQHIGADHTDFATGDPFRISPDTAHVDCTTVNIKHRCRCNSANVYILEFLVPVFDRLANVCRHSHAPTRAAQTRNG